MSKMTREEFDAKMHKMIKRGINLREAGIDMTEWKSELKKIYQAAEDSGLDIAEAYFKGDMEMPSSKLSCIEQGISYIGAYTFDALIKDISEKVDERANDGFRVKNISHASAFGPSGFSYYSAIIVFERNSEDVAMDTKN